MVWLGYNRTLIRLDPSTGHVRTWAIPPPPKNPDEDRFGPGRPPQPAVWSLAVSPAGDIAVGMWPASSLFTLDPTTSRFLAVDFPGVDDQELSMGYDGGGALAVGYSDVATGGKANRVLVMSTETSGWRADPTTTRSAWWWIRAGRRPYHAGGDVLEKRQNGWPAG
jgi:hypothetical protein